MTAPTDESERRVRLTLHYDGTDFHGWQVQPDARTVQGELETGLSRLTNRRTRVIAAGRTDRGVHATGQVAAADVPPRWTATALRGSLNAILPHDIWIAAADPVAAAFHARYDAVGRRYVYRIGTRPAARSPFRRRWCWPLAEPLDLDVLNRAAETIVGEHSFRAFAKAGQPRRGDRCTVHHARWRAWQDVGVELDITANRFLHHMVRYLVGTMVDIARGRRSPDEMSALLNGAAAAPSGTEERTVDGTEANGREARPVRERVGGRRPLVTSAPAPAAGLYLVRVYYSAEEMQRENGIDEDLP